MSNLIDRNQGHIDILRAKRATAFKAFDIYKENVNYGLINETNEQHANIVVWYQLCLNLDRQAIENVPDVIKPYLKAIRGGK